MGENKERRVGKVPQRGVVGAAENDGVQRSRHRPKMVGGLAMSGRGLASGAALAATSNSFFFLANNNANNSETLFLPTLPALNIRVLYTYPHNLYNYSTPITCLHLIRNTRTQYHVHHSMLEFQSVCYRCVCAVAFGRRVQSPSCPRQQRAVSGEAAVRLTRGAEMCTHHPVDGRRTVCICVPQHRVDLRWPVKTAVDL